EGATTSARSSSSTRQRLTAPLPRGARGWTGERATPSPGLARAILIPPPARSSGREALYGARSPLGRLELAVLGRGGGHKLIQQTRRGERDLIDSPIESV